MAKSKKNKKRPKYSRTRQIYKYRTLLRSYYDKKKIKEEIKAIGRVTWFDSFVQYLFLALFVALAIYQIYWNGSFTFEKPGLKNLSVFLLTLGVSIPALFQYSIRQEIKREDMENKHPDKIREYWRKIDLIHFFALFIFWIGIIVGNFLNSQYSSTTMATLLGASVLMIVRGMTIIGSLKPYLLFSNWYGHLYEGFRKTTHFALLLLILSFYSPSYSPNYLNILAYLVFFFVLDFVIKKLFPEKYSSVLSGLIIRHAKIDSLMLSFSSYAQGLIKKKSAENDLKRRLKNGEYDYVQAFVQKARSIEGVSKVDKYIPYILVSIIVYIATLVFESISEGLIQDMFNESIKEYLCEKMDILCN